MEYPSDEKIRNKRKSIAYAITSFHNGWRQRVFSFSWCYKSGRIWYVYIGRERGRGGEEIEKGYTVSHMIDIYQKAIMQSNHAIKSPAWSEGAVSYDSRQTMQD